MQPGCLDPLFRALRVLRAKNARIWSNEVYCYSETYLVPSVTGVDTAPRFGMDFDAILDTRTRFITEGPYFDETSLHER